MAKFESPMMVIRELRRQEATDIPTKHTITSIYQKFLETGSIHDHTLNKKGFFPNPQKGSVDVKKNCRIQSRNGGIFYFIFGQ